jgi:fucose permease
MVIVFTTMGHLALSTVAWVPTFINRLDVDFSTWGLIIGFSIIGSILPLTFASRLIMRFGTRALIRIGSIIGVLALMSLILTVNPLIWYFCNTFFAFSMSLLGISVNTHGVMLQRHIGRTVVGRFHAGWSIGAVAAAITGSISVAFMTLEVFLLVVAIFSLVAMEIGIRSLLPADSDTDISDRIKPSDGKREKTPPIVWLLALGLFAGVFPEIVIIDWSAVFARDVMGLEVGLRALPFGAFMVGMVIGRLAMTRITKRLHPSELSSWGGYMAAAMLTISVVFGPTLSAANQLLGLSFIMLFWLVLGLGMAAMAPAFTSAAGHVEGMNTARVLTRMTLTSALVQIGAKTLMGALAQGFSLTAAMFFPIVLLVLSAAIAGRVAKLAKRKELENAYPMTGSIAIINLNDEDEDNSK